MTVYIVVARNGRGDEWIDAVLSKEELAKEYIKNRENRELNELETYWCRCSGVCPTYRIDIFDVLEYIF